MLTWHFEGRHARNVTPTVHADELDPSWELLPKAMSAYHQDPDAEVELKYIRPDAKSFLGLGSSEAVWDPNEQRWLEAGAYGSTYNYVSPRGILSGVGHFVVDVVPYWLFGTDRGTKHRSFIERVTGK